VQLFLENNFVVGGSLKPFDVSGVFTLVVEDHGLRRSAVRGAGITVFSQGVIFAIQMIATVLLARLLTPADFGVVTMVTTFSLLLMSFGVNGYSEAVIQREDMNHSLASNLFWINVGVSLLFAIGFAAAGSLLARFYNDPRVAQASIGLALTIFISGTSVVHLALLKRALRFSLTSSNDIVSAAISVLLMVVLAGAGWGYWALVAGAVARTVAQSIGAWCLCSWMPGLPRRAAGTGSIARFAANVYGRFSLNYFARNSDNLLVGWRFGPGALGSYKKAYDLFVLPASQLLGPVDDVALSTLSRLERGSAQYRRYFLNGLSFLAFIGMAIGAILTIEGKDLIRLLLGPQWKTAGQIFTFFGPGVGIMLVYNCSGLIHLSIGRADRWLRWVVVELTVTALLFIVGLTKGPAGVAAAWTASFWILTIPAFWYAGKPIKFGVAPMIGIVWKYALASIVAGYSCFAIANEIPALLAASGVVGALTRITMISLLFSVLYVGAVAFLHGGFDTLRQFARLLPEMLPQAASEKTRPPAAAESVSPQDLDNKPRIPESFTSPEELRSGN
jgi:O-antigen/teichoic acid export membrane protein